jgi:hypothetical protein
VKNPAKNSFPIPPKISISQYFNGNVMATGVAGIRKKMARLSAVKEMSIARNTKNMIFQTRVWFIGIGICGSV